MLKITNINISDIEPCAETDGFLEPMCFRGPWRSDRIVAIATGPLWLYSNKGTKSLTGVFVTFYARRTFGNSAAPKIGSCLVRQFWGLNTDRIPQPFSHPKTFFKPHDRLEAIL